MLEEISKNSSSLTQEREENAFVEVNNLTCYWDKVKCNSLTAPVKNIEMNSIMLL